MRWARGNEWRWRVQLTLLLGTIATLSAVDTLLDHGGHLISVHVLLETGSIVLVLSATTYVWLGWARTRRRLESALANGRAERDLWRQRTRDLLGGLGVEVDSQLRRWGLSPTERETVILLLKGHEHKEIATLLGKSERTVRQQSVAIYRKCGVPGRAGLAGFFLEPMLLPDDAELDSPPGFAEAARGGAARS